MGVYIPGIKLPKDEPGAFQVIVMYVGADGKLRAECGGTHEVVPVPKHGRLIQDDASDEIEHYHDGSFGLTDYERGWNAALLLCKKRIEAAPTIIPAEEGEA